MELYIYVSMITRKLGHGTREGGTTKKPPLPRSSKRKLKR